MENRKLGIGNVKMEIRWERLGQKIEGATAIKQVAPSKLSRKSFSLCRFHLATRPAVRPVAPSKRNRQSYSPCRFHLGTQPAVRRAAPSQWNRQGFELRSSSSRRNRCLGLLRLLN
jgi:hypothetical protein